MCYDRSNLWLAHSSVQNFLPSNAFDPSRVSSALGLLQRLARRPVHRRSGRLRPSRPCRQPASRARTRQGAVSSPRRYTNQPLLGSTWHKLLKAAARRVAFPNVSIFKFLTVRNLMCHCKGGGCGNARVRNRALSDGQPKNAESRRCARPLRSLRVANRGLRPARNDEKGEAGAERSLAEPSRAIGAA